MADDVVEDVLQVKLSCDVVVLTYCVRRPRSTPLENSDDCRWADGTFHLIVSQQLNLQAISTTQLKSRVFLCKVNPSLFIFLNRFLERGDPFKFEILRLLEPLREIRDRLSASSYQMMQILANLLAGSYMCFSKIGELSLDTINAIIPSLYVKVLKEFRVKQKKGDSINATNGRIQKFQTCIEENVGQDFIPTDPRCEKYDADNECHSKEKMSKGEKDRQSEHDDDDKNDCDCPSGYVIVQKMSIECIAVPGSREKARQNTGIMHQPLSKGEMKGLPLLRTTAAGTPDHDDGSGSSDVSEDRKPSKSAKFASGKENPGSSKFPSTEVQGEKAKQADELAPAAARAPDIVHTDKMQHQSCSKEDMKGDASSDTTSGHVTGHEAKLEREKDKQIEELHVEAPDHDDSSGSSGNSDDRKRSKSAKSARGKEGPKFAGGKEGPKFAGGRENPDSSHQALSSFSKKKAAEQSPRTSFISQLETPKMAPSSVLHPRPDLLVWQHGLSEISFKKLKAATDGFNSSPVTEGGCFLGSGSFGDVYLGHLEWKDIPSLVAVKKFKPVQ